MRSKTIASSSEHKEEKDMRKRDYEWFYFEVRTNSGKLVATFQARWMAEMFAEHYKSVGVTVEEIKLEEEEG